MKHLTVRQLITALDNVPGNPLVIIAGFSIATVPGSLARHRTHTSDLAIEVVHQRVNPVTVNRLTAMLYTHATQPATRLNPDPTTLDSPAWVRAHQESAKSFYAVTCVDFVKGHAVIRSENVARAQGPSVQRITDEEMLRRNFELSHPSIEAPNLDADEKINRWLLNAIPNERTKVRVRLESARQDLEDLLRSIPIIEAESDRLDYILGITDTAPESARHAA